MNYESNDEIRGAISIADYAGRYTQLKGRPGKDRSGPCPFCKAGDNRFNVFKDDKGWICRKCQFPKAGDIFTFVMRMENCDFKEARTILRAYLGVGQTTRKLVTPTVTQPTKEVKEEYKTEGWQTRSKATVKAAVNAIKGSMSWDYLAARGIDDDAIKAFALGHKRMKPKEGPEYDALVIPWILKDKTLTMIKYRRLGADHKARFFTASGSTPILFGAHLAQNRDTAIIIEGELNCVSVWMAASDLADCLSVGGDSLVEQMVAAGSLYGKVLYWVDDLSKAKKIKELRPRANIYLSQPITDDLKGDANDWLKHFGVITLRELIKRLLERE